MWSQLPSYASVSRSIQNRLPRRWSKSQRYDDLPVAHPCVLPSPAAVREQSPAVMDTHMEDATSSTSVTPSFAILPVDILHRVFMSVGPNILDKIRISHVCKNWRTVALSFPLMWTHLDLDSLSGLATVAMVLQRSKGLPLSLHCSVWTALRHSVSKSEIRRARELDLVVDSYSQITLRSFLENTPAPALVRCRIEASSYEVQAPAIFANQHPHLQDLALVNCRMAYAPGNYTGLRSLELRCTLEPDLTYPDDQCLIEIFKWCPDLEEVVLHGCAVHPQLTRDYVGHGHGIVRLPKLRSMDLRLRTSNVHAIMSSLQPSPDVALKIAAYTCPKSPEQDRIVSDDSPLMTVALSRARAVVLDGKTSRMHAFTDTSFHNQYMSMQLDYRHPHDSFDLLLKPAIAMMPHLERLQLRGLPEETIISVLQLIPSIKALDLCFDEPDTHAINVVSRISDEANSGLCPDLSALSLSGASVDMFGRTALAGVQSALPGLQHLALYECKFDRSVEALSMSSKAFDKVDWFGRSEAGPPFMLI